MPHLLSLEELLYDLEDWQLIPYLSGDFLRPNEDAPFPRSKTLILEVLKEFCAWQFDPYDPEIDRDWDGYVQDRLWCRRQAVRAALAYRWPKVYLDEVMPKGFLRQFGSHQPFGVGLREAFYG